MHKLAYSIRWRFVILIVTILLLVFGVLAAALIRNSSELLKKNLTDSSVAFSELATKPIGDTFLVYKDSGKIQIDKQVRDFLELNDNVINVAIVGLLGNIEYQLSSVGSESFTPLIPTAIGFDSSVEDKDDLLIITIPYFENNLSHRYSLVYSISKVTINDAIKKEGNTLLIFSLIGLLLAAILASIFVNTLIIRPVVFITRQAREISNGDFEKQIVTNRHDEIGSLASSVNQMAKSLKSDIVKLRELDMVKTEFMMIISHNLLSPLTVINGYLEDAELLTTKQQYQNAITHIADSARHLGVFAEDVLAISKIELGRKIADSAEINTASFFDQIITEMESSAKIKKIKFEYTILSLPNTIYISKALIRSAIFNVFENSLKFTKEGGSVTLNVQRMNDELLISISDTGIGINPEELTKLFTKFHRGTSTMTYDYEGIGMGLYASKVMIEANGGTIEATSKVGEGSTFTIHLPTKLHQPEHAEANN